ncbi:MAG: adenylosuccinate synthase [Flavobacteriaceae bacterium]|nr:adenylosuccinate synthase [Flavobacteriaceae bacterium]|tara:strand:- start:12919 stop:14196 length:1278 start_codon:yes stop_codon:yes gene_type:complete
MIVDLILGLQWGDEGKGKIVDVLTKSYDIIARFQGGPNAGHTLKFDGNKHILHTIPSGIFHSDALNVIGNGVVIDPVIFKKEIENLKSYNIDFSSKLLLSKKAHLILPTHRLLDAASEKSKGKGKIGSTLKGIGPTYMDKTGRNGIRVGDISQPNWKEKYSTLSKKHLKMLNYFNSKIDFNLKALEDEFFKSLNSLKLCQIVDSEYFINDSLKKGKKVLAEGAQGSLLDIDFGTYPYVTSSNTTAAGACTGLGIAPNKINDVFGVFKAYVTRVGSGPFPTELNNKDGERLANIGKEFGSTTGRKRRCGWIDLVALKYAIEINGVTKLIMMKADVLSGFEKIYACVSYKTSDGKIINHFPYDSGINGIEPVYKELDGWMDEITEINNPNSLPISLKNYIAFIEEALETPIKIISLGPDRKQTIYVN